MLTKALVVGTIIQIAAASWLDGDDNIDRPGGDMLKFPIHLVANDPPSKCGQLCLDTPDCVAWAYCKRAKCDPKVPLCYLKSTVTTQSWNGSMVRLPSCVWLVCVRRRGCRPPSFFVFYTRVYQLAKYPSTHLIHLYAFI